MNRARFFTITPVPYGDCIVIGTYSGIRPATQHIDYQIRLVPEISFISVGGIRSTGLTAASGIAEYVHALVMEQEHNNNGNVRSSDKKHHNAVLPQLAENVVPPYLPSVEYNIAWNSESNGTITPNPPIPELSVLARDHQKRGDGFVESDASSLHSGNETNGNWKEGWGGGVERRQRYGLRVLHMQRERTVMSEKLFYYPYYSQISRLYTL